MYGLTNGGRGMLGDRLLLRVIGGLSAPANPKENDIWVKTSLAIPGSWGVYFSMQVEDFWHGVANGGIYIPFEASVFGKSTTTGAQILQSAKAGNLAEFCVNFLGCQQRENDAWVQREAYIYHSATGWNQFSTLAPVWNGALFDSGNQYTDVTGGWIQYPNYTTPSGNKLNASGTNITAAFYTTNKIDVTKYSKLCFTGHIVVWTGDGQTCGFGLMDHPFTWDTISYVAGLRGQEFTNGVVDISGVSGSYYVTTHIVCDVDAGIDISKIWLE